MSWLAVLLLVVIGFILAGASTALLSGRRPKWQPRTRVVVAALVAPVLILAGCLLGAAIASGQASGDMRDLAAAALISIGVQGAMIAFVSGLLAAFLADRALRSS